MCQDVLLVHFQLAVWQDPRAFFHRAAVQLICPQPLSLHGVLPFHVQVFAFSPVEIHKVSVSPFLQPVLLHGSPAVKILTALLNVVSSPKLTKVHSSAFSRALVKLLNTSVPRLDLLGTLIFYEPLIWIWLVKFYTLSVITVLDFYLLVVHSPSLWCANSHARKW